MSKVIFLDIDGVLNTTGDKKLINNMVEESKLNNLVNLINNTQSVLVVISDRRLLEDERLNIESIFDNFEILVKYLSLKRTHRKRSDEVLYYLNNHKDITNYVILDDNDLGYSEDIVLYPHFINTYKNGFGEDEYNKAIIILNNCAR